MKSIVTLVLNLSSPVFFGMSVSLEYRKQQRIDDGETSAPSISGFVHILGLDSRLIFGGLGFVVNDSSIARVSSAAVTDKESQNGYCCSVVSKTLPS